MDQNPSLKNQMKHLVQHLAEIKTISTLFILSLFLFLQKADAQVYSRDFVTEELKNMYNRDQDLREELVQIEQNWNNHSQKISDSLWAQVTMLDSLNLLSLNKMQENYGWDSLMGLDDFSKYTIFLIIQHADANRQRYYFPLIFDAVKAKKLPPEDFALLKDRLELSISGKQYYGTQYFWDSKKDANVLFPFKIKKDKVEKLRKKLGLPRLSEYIESINR